MERIPGYRLVTYRICTEKVKKGIATRIVVLYNYFINTAERWAAAKLQNKVNRNAEENEAEGDVISSVVKLT